MRAMLMALLLAAARLAYAHGGEDHGAAKVVAPSGGPRVSGVGDRVEVLVEADHAHAGEPSALTVFVADAVTNEPVARAHVVLELTGPVELRAEAKATEQPGIYRAEATLPVGTFAPVVDVAIGEQHDLVALGSWAVADDDDHPAHLSGGVTVAVTLVVLALVAGLSFALRRRRVAVAASLFLLLPFTAQAHGSEPHAEVAAPPAQASGSITFPKASQFLLGIRTDRIEPGRIEERAEVFGRVLPSVNGAGQVAAPFGGVLDPSVRLPTPGERVRKGQVVAVLIQAVPGPDQVTLDVSRERLAGELRETDAEVTKAHADVERLNQLEGVVAEKERIAARAELKRLEARRDAARRALGTFGADEVGKKGVRTRLVAPISGVVSELAVTDGQYVAGNAVVLSIVDLSRVWVEASLFPSDLARLGGARTADVRVDAFPERTFTGRLIGLSPTVDEATQAARVRFEVANADGLLRPGMFADVSLGEGRVRNALIVPDAAILESEGRRLVFVKTGPESFTAREVKLGARDGERWEVLGGLGAGELVAVSGTWHLRAAGGR